MLTQLADGTVSDDDYAQIDRETAAATAEIQERLETVERGRPRYRRRISYLENLLWNARYVWKGSDLQGKQRLQRKSLPRKGDHGRARLRKTCNSFNLFEVRGRFVSESEMVRLRRRFQNVDASIARRHGHRELRITTEQFSDFGENAWPLWRKRLRFEKSINWLNGGQESKLIGATQ